MALVSAMEMTEAFIKLDPVKSASKVLRERTNPSRTAMAASAKCGQGSFGDSNISWRSRQAKNGTTIRSGVKSPPRRSLDGLGRNRASGRCRPKRETIPTHHAPRRRALMRDPV